MKRLPKWFNVLLSTRDAVYVVNERQRIVAWNGGAERLLGYSGPEVLKRHCYELIAGRASGAARCFADCPILKAAKRGVAPESFNVQTRTKDGRDVWVNVSIFSCLRNGRRLLVHLLRDVTCEERRKEVLEQILAALEMHGMNDRKAANVRTAQGPASAPDTCPTAWTSLTRREVEVLRLLAQGLTGKAIAGRLGVSLFTVRRHIESILQKTGMHTQAQAVAYTFRAGIL